MLCYDSLAPHSWSAIARKGFRASSFVKNHPLCIHHWPTGHPTICLLDITCDQFSLGGTGHIQTMQAWTVWEEGSYLPTGLGTNNVLGALGCPGGLIDVC